MTWMVSLKGAVKYAENPEVARQISPDKLKVSRFGSVRVYSESRISTGMCRT